MSDKPTIQTRSLSADSAEAKALSSGWDLERMEPKNMELVRAHFRNLKPAAPSKSAPSPQAESPPIT